MTISDIMIVNRQRVDKKPANLANVDYAIEKVIRRGSLPV